MPLSFFSQSIWLLRVPKSVLPLALFFAVSAMPLAAQAPRGPLPPPPPSSDSSASAPTPVSSAPPVKRRILGGAESALIPGPPPVPVEQIIQKFSQHEEEFKRERDNYTYTQSFIIQTIDEDGNPDGEYRMDSDIL